MSRCFDCDPSFGCFVAGPCRKGESAWRATIATLTEERDALRARRDELLAAMVRITRETPYPEEAGNAGVLLAEVGTLKARLSTALRERDEALADGVLSQRVCDLMNERDALRSTLDRIRDELMTANLDVSTDDAPDTLPHHVFVLRMALDERGTQIDEARAECERLRERLAQYEGSDL